MRRTRGLRLAGLLAAVAVGAAACGGDPGASDAVVVSGSSTVEPISALNAELFVDSHPHLNITISVDGPGTGDGFQRFCAGQTAISDASRPIKDEEAELCAANGVEYVELKVGIDGIVVLTSTANDVVECVDFAALYALTGPESEGFGTWEEASSLANELGSNHPETFPNEELVVVGPGEESGTYDTYVELVIEEFEDRIEEQDVETATRPDYQASANDNVIVEGIQGSEYSLGWVGYAFYTENQDDLKALAVDGGDGCVTPTDDTIASGEYPLSRPLFIYVNEQMLQDNEVLREYVRFYLSDEGRGSVSAVGYVQLTDEAWQATKDRFESAVDG